MTFSISAEKLYWINNQQDDPEDLCLHGYVVAVIGEEKFECPATVSSTALYLLKSLTEDHIIVQENQMLPCCGHTILPNEELDNVKIVGCCYGTDWSVIHDEGFVKLISSTGKETILDIEEYGKIVYGFCDTIESFYNKCSQKIVPDDAFYENGYTAFWNEWHRRRYFEQHD